MSGKTNLIYLIAASLLLAACAGGAGASTPIPVPATLTESPFPTATAGPSSTPPPIATEASQPFVIYDFLQLACQASWSNNGQGLDCPGEQWHIIGSGYVGVIEDPVLEGDVLLNEPALLTHPSNAPDYYGIFGAYPAMTIKEGDEFRATIGCLAGVEAESCDAQYSLDYYNEDGDYQPLMISWDESYDGQLTDISADLSFLAGQTVRLVLVVRDNGDSFGDYTVWLHPALWRMP